jgi:hypothetical protein
VSKTNHAATVRNVQAAARRSPEDVRIQTDKKLDTLRKRLTVLEEARPSLTFDAHAGIESAVEELAINESAAASLAKEIRQLETLTTEATRRVAAGRTARLKAVIRDLVDAARELEAAVQHATVQARIKEAELEEAEIQAGVARAREYALADILYALTGDPRFKRNPRVLTFLTSEDKLERFRTSFYRDVRARRQTDAPPAWQPLVDEARALTNTKGAQ